MKWILSGSNDFFWEQRPAADGWHLGHFKIKSLGNGVSRDLQEVFSTKGAMLFHQHTRKAENNAIEISQVFHNITWFKHFTNLNLFKYAFNVIQDWEMDALFFFFNGAYKFFVSSWGRTRWKQLAKDG